MDDKKDVEMAMLGEGKENGADVKVISGATTKESSDNAAYAGMGREELMELSMKPFWVRLRLILLVLFWIVWVAMFVAAVAIVVTAPKCKETKSKAERAWAEPGVSAAQISAGDAAPTEGQIFVEAVYQDEANLKTPRNDFDVSTLEGDEWDGKKKIVWLPFPSNVSDPSAVNALVNAVDYWLDNFFSGVCLSPVMFADTEEQTLAVLKQVKAVATKHSTMMASKHVIVMSPFDNLDFTGLSPPLTLNNSDARYMFFSQLYTNVDAVLCNMSAITSGNPPVPYSCPSVWGYEVYYVSMGEELSAKLSAALPGIPLLADYNASSILKNKDNILLQDGPLEILKQEGQTFVYSIADRKYLALVNTDIASPSTLDLLTLLSLEEASGEYVTVSGKVGDDFAEELDLAAFTMPPSSFAIILIK